MIRSLKLIAVGAIAVMAIGWVLQADPLTLTILHTNDMHAHYDSFEPWGEPVQGGVARLKTAIDDIRSSTDDVLLLDAGDQFQGTLYFNIGGAQVAADVMNALGYDAMCVGNHEFDSGPAELETFAGLVRFPVLSANIDASAKPVLSSALHSYFVFELTGERVGVIGLTTEEAAELSSPGPLVEFIDAAVAAQAAVTELEEQGVNKIIALTHLGYSKDVALATSVSGIDVIVGGHSHTLMTTTGEGIAYPTQVAGADGAPVYIVTAHEWGKVLGQLTVTFDDSGQVTSAEGNPLFIDESIAEDPQLLGLLSVYAAEIDELKSTVVGSTEVLLNGERGDVRSRETTLGNVMCDAILWRTEAARAEIALQNSGGIRSTLRPGDVTMGDLIEVHPYGNQISIVDLTGAQVIAALENGVSQVEDGAGRFPQVGGVRLTFSRAAPAGSRVETVEVFDSSSGAYAPIDLDATYRVATNNYLASGGDGYDVLESGANLYDTGLVLSDTLAEYFAEFSPVTAVLEGRIREE